MADIKLTDRDVAVALQEQVASLTQQVSRLATEKAALSRVITEMEVAAAADKEPKKAEKKA